MRAPTRSLVAALSAQAPAATLILARATEWHSATFDGLRHFITLGFVDRAAAAGFARRIEDREFTLPGVLVADLKARLPASVAGAFYVRIEALTIDAD